MPRGWGFSSFFIGSVGQGFELSFARGGEFGHQKNCPGVLPGGNGQAWDCSALIWYAWNVYCDIYRHLPRFAQSCPNWPN